MVIILIQIIIMLRKISLNNYGLIFRNDWAMSRIVIRSLSEFVSLKTYPWDHKCSAPYSDGRSDTPRYPKRHLKSIRLGNTRPEIHSCIKTLTGIRNLLSGLFTCCTMWIHVRQDMAPAGCCLLLGAAGCCLVG